ncbi:hypothetical protein [Leptolyngbya sp. BL0902]|uniref:hypothetical protein n=1 Tax=Leptolyngbya sp. BL0902 TaxID=1115757 RepID=UPI0018E7B096|nr:hypothetical protein [Leptolyngbya sp. BL0902]
MPVSPHPRGPKRWGRWSLGIVLAGLSGLALAPEAAWANDLCSLDPGSHAALSGALPTLSTSFAQDVCQILTMPTNSRSESERFTEQIEPGSRLDHTSPSAETMTLPSLWWTRDSLPPQLGRHRLVDAWVSYTIHNSDVRVVDVMINSQFWRALSMPQRYGVLTQFGNAAQEFGYHLRFFQNNGYSARMIGLYACDTHQAAPTPQCLVTVETLRIVQLQQAMQSQPSSPIADQPADPSTPQAAIPVAAEVSTAP